MSGSVGGDRIISRQLYNTVFNTYVSKLKVCPFITTVVSTGSYISDISKQTFGDMDLVIQLNTELPKKEAKLELAKWLVSNGITSEFRSEKYKGKSYLNTGEIITIGYSYDDKLYQIDNIVSLSNEETNFKQQFLNLPAEKQGLLIGLIKVSMDNTSVKDVLSKLDIDINIPKGYRVSTNISSSELSIRAEMYSPGTFKTIDKKILWKTNDWKYVTKLLTNYNVITSYDTMLQSVANNVSDQNIKNRIFGVLNSMVSVKSGEVGTEKGNNKIRNIALARTILVK